MSSRGESRTHCPRSRGHAGRRLHEIARCRTEVAAVETQIRAGHPDLRGLLLALADWSGELRLLEKELGQAGRRQLGDHRSEVRKMRRLESALRHRRRQQR